MTRPPRAPLTARTADKYDLYQRSVQDPEHEVDMFLRLYRQSRGGRPRTLREDFCGTAAVCGEWVRSHRDRHAVGLDLDPVPLAWGTRHNLGKLTDEQRSRVKLLKQDVRSVTRPAVDIVSAQNFSFWVFKTRPEVRRYFQCVRRSLAPDGVFILDMVGGTEMMEEDRLEKRRAVGFQYQWEQARFDPITHHCMFHIHFGFKDGSLMKRAFTYDWRMWTMPEVRELLLEAGFKTTHVHWLDKDKAGNETYRRHTTAPSDPTWLAYVVAER